jgi:cytochrome oxidase assembly protein ShyY1
MYRFLLTPKWIVGHVLLVVTVVSFVNLGFWQLRRLDERLKHNALIEQRLAAAPAPLDELLRTVGSEPTALDFRRVVVTGRYQPDNQLLTAPRSRDGRPGPQVLTVLHRDGDRGPVLLDRGWIPFDRDTLRAPPAPDGQVRIEGVVRAPEEGAIGAAEQVARIVPEQIGVRIGQPLPAFYVQLWEQRPPLGEATPLPGRAPVLTEGNHLSYALQWFSFALIALIGYPVLVRRAARERRGGDSDGGRPAPEERPARMPIR